MNRLIGAHVSIAGGLDTCIDRAAAIGANAIQTFASSPRTIHYSPIPEPVIGSYLKKRAENEVKFHIFHGVYLINLAHENPAYVDVCCDSLRNYQTLAGKIGALGTIFHVGSHKGLGLSHYLPQIAQAIAVVLASSPPDTWLLLENAAGQKGTIGQRFDELKSIIEAVAKRGVPVDKLGIGVDTQHAFASGYDLRTVLGLETLLNDIEMTVGLEKLKVIHINDSAAEFAGNRDRHANLNEGNIGAENIARVVNHPQLRHLPMILEVPGDKLGPRKEDVETLKALVKD